MREGVPGPLRRLRANDPGPFTLDGTSTWIVGHRRIAVVDPGPDMDDHVRAVVSLAREAEEVTLLVTHGHGDHVGAVDRVRAELPHAQLIGHGHPGARSPWARGDEGSGRADGTMPESDGGVVVAETDAGALSAVPAPGHTRDHLVFHWPAGRALFVGDLVLGRGDTTWVAEYPGCVADWLGSIDRVRRLDLDRILSAHGPPIEDPEGKWERVLAHRKARIESVRRALEAEDLSPSGARAPELLERVLSRVYGGTIPEGLGSAARRSLDAMLEYVDTHPEGP